MDAQSIDGHDHHDLHTGPNLCCVIFIFVRNNLVDSGKTLVSINAKNQVFDHLMIRKTVLDARRLP